MASDKIHWPEKLDPVGSTVRYESMKLCTGSVYDTIVWGGSSWQLIILGQKRAFMPLYIEKSGDPDRCHGCLTDSLTHWQTLKDRAAQYNSGALLTQYYPNCVLLIRLDWIDWKTSTILHPLTVDTHCPDFATCFSSFDQNLTQS